jgi:hypothetical protein
MYGTIAKMRVKPGQGPALQEWGQRADAPAGTVAVAVFQMDADPTELYMVAMADSKEAYFANADSPEQHQRYLEMMQFLAAEPEWHDGEIIFYQTA